MTDPKLTAEGVLEQLRCVEWDSSTSFAFELTESQALALLERLMAQVRDEILEKAARAIEVNSDGEDVNAIETVRALKTGGEG
jgi:hypothetical protein